MTQDLAGLGRVGPELPKKVNLPGSALRALSLVRRRRVAAWTQVSPAGARAIGGLGRSRCAGGRGGAMGFAWAIRRFFAFGGRRKGE